MNRPAACNYLLQPEFEYQGMAQLLHVRCDNLSQSTRKTVHNVDGYDVMAVSGQYATAASQNLWDSNASLQRPRLACIKKSQTMT